MSIDSAVYPSALASFMQADIDMDGGTIQVRAVTSGYVYSAAHNFLDDVSGGFRLGTAFTLTSKTFGVVGTGMFNAAGGTYTGLANGNVVDGFVGYLSTGVDSTSPLIWYVNHRSDAVELEYTSDGTGVSIAWPLGFIFSI